MTGLYLVAAFIFFSIVYAVQLYYSKSFLLKIFVITIVFGLSSVIYFSFETYKGWPTDQKVADGILSGAMVIEPNESDPGAIYLWVVSEQKEASFIDSILTYRPKSAITPRAFQLPYSKKFANAVQNALEQMKKGYAVEISNIDEQNKGNGDSNNNGNGNGDNNGLNSTDNSGTGGIGGDGNDTEYNVPHLSLVDPRQNDFKKE